MALTLRDNDEAHELLLVHEIARQLRTCFDRRAQHLGLTRSQWRLLGILRRWPGMRQAKLAEMMEVEPITLGRLLDRMEKSGWIKRVPDPNDRRANSVVLTDKVGGILKEMRSVALDLRRETLEGFSEREYSQFLTYLQRMKRNVAAILCAEGVDACPDGM